MSQRCPVCKSKLWTDPFFAPTRLVCPRCGAVFQTSVPWRSFRLLVFLVISLSIVVMVLLSGRKPWLLVILIGLVLFFWSLPRLINLQHISSDLTVAEGPADPDRMRMDFEPSLLEKKEKREEEKLFRKLVFLVLLAAALAVFVLFWVNRFL